MLIAELASQMSWRNTQRLVGGDNELSPRAFSWRSPACVAFALGHACKHQPLAITIYGGPPTGCDIDRDQCALPHMLREHAKPITLHYICTQNSRPLDPISIAPSCQRDLETQNAIASCGHWRVTGTLEGHVAHLQRNHAESAIKADHVDQFASGRRRTLERDAFPAVFMFDDHERTLRSTNLMIVLRRREDRRHPRSVVDGIDHLGGRRQHACPDIAV